MKRLDGELAGIQPADGETALLVGCDRKEGQRRPRFPEVQRPAIGRGNANTHLADARAGGIDQCALNRTRRPQPDVQLHRHLRVGERDRLHLAQVGRVRDYQRVVPAKRDLGQLVRAIPAVDAVHVKPLLDGPTGSAD